MKDIRAQSDAELQQTVADARETMRAERFKDKLSRKASVIRNAKTTVARALTELTARRRKPTSK
ncbi:hypothetical protein GVX82_00195 [Patescibacteria group bacterium]|nr:hypothetical protein [Patescibacteria group bacterium]